VVILTGCFTFNTHWTECWICPSQSSCFGKQINLISLPGIRTKFLSHPAYKLTYSIFWKTTKQRWRKILQV
jgi:hypothetical protein